MKIVMNSALWSFPWAVAVCFFATIPVAAQSVQQRDVMVSGQLSTGFEEGVNSSSGNTGWVAPNPADGSQKMSCPPAQDWCAMFVTFGPPVNPPRPGTDMSSYASLLVELRGDAGKTIQVGIKDNIQDDSGNEQKVTVLLTTDWRTYAIPLSSFSRANLGKVYVACEFVWAASSPWTAYVRNVRYSSAPAPSIATAVNAASFQAGLVAGGWNSITGKSLSSTTRPWGGSDFQGATLPVSLDGISVSLGERKMAVYYISPGQINYLIFGDVLAGQSYLAVTTALGTSLPVPVTVQSLFPAIFTIDPNNKYAAAVHADGTIVGKAGLFGPAVTTRPAAPNETILVYGTGFGPTTPPVVQDQVIQSAVPLANASSWQARIGSQSSPIGFAGLTSSGLYQFNVTVPNVPDGDQTLVLSNGSSTTVTVTITVQK